MAIWIKWGFVIMSWGTLAFVVFLLASGRSPISWHPIGYLLTLDLLQSAAILIAVLAFVVVQTLGVISRSAQIAVGVERMADDLIASVSSGTKALIEQIASEDPQSAAVISETGEQLIESVESDIRKPFARRAWTQFHWQANLLAVVACVCLLVSTACEAELVSKLNTPTLVKIGWVYALYFSAAWIVLVACATRIWDQKPSRDEITLSALEKESDRIKAKIEDTRDYFERRRGN